MRKKLLALVTICVLALSIIACGNSAPVAEGELTFDVPDGFVKDVKTDEDGTVTTYYYAPDEQLSNINMFASANDGSFVTATSELLIPQLEVQLSSYYGEDITLSLVEEKSHEVEGCRAYTYSYEYTVSGIDLVQIQSIVETKDDLYFVTFTEIADEKFYETFMSCVDTYRFE